MKIFGSLLLIGLSWGTAMAAEVSYVFSGTVKSVYDLAAESGLQVGDEITGGYTLDDTTPYEEYVGYELPYRIYQDAMTELSVDFGEVSIIGSNNNVIGIQPGTENAEFNLYTVTAVQRGCSETGSFDLFAYSVTQKIVDESTPLNSAPLISNADPAARVFSLNLDTCAGNRVRVAAELTSLELASAGTPSEQIEGLTSLVLEINIQSGVSNALDSKLDSALAALDDSNEKNDGAALNSMYAFCNSVSAQSGKKITEAQADQLFAAANGIISSLDEYAPLCQ
jgi:hypothetical protein